jgi:hypothetical protein
MVSLNGIEKLLEYVRNINNVIFLHCKNKYLKLLYKKRHKGLNLFFIKLYYTCFQKKHVQH